MSYKAKVHYTLSICVGVRAAYVVQIEAHVVTKVTSRSDDFVRAHLE